ncbi:hypothetical protein T4D_1215, partial [Trichinella pseudospiralis]
LIMKSDTEHKRLNMMYKGLNNENSSIHIYRQVPTNKTSKTSHDIKWNASYPYHWNYSQKSLTYNYLPFLKHANSIANEEKNTSREFLEFLSY